MSNALGLSVSDSDSVALSKPEWWASLRQKATPREKGEAPVLETGSGYSKTAKNAGQPPPPSRHQTHTSRPLATTST